MRFLGLNIPDNKRAEISLSYIYGIGIPSARRIIKAAKIDSGKRLKDLDAQELNQLKDYIEKNYKIEGELRQSIKQNINRLKEIVSYRGARHLRRLPVRGQRTKTNSRTVRGNVRRTVGSGRRKTELK
ncbi:30S ribosomal protein S13 [Candidatus Jorgensenbacteria bacterium RIFCSPLOWO2_12_FULL_42_11]|uniref:Small ribosomal subunit protein uS13 n=1 Tax=Candidatus Jorgensenbacteria bacterium RIFCSPLOWO2_12_FULL_42_11 TaxID=1798473 RepID=A0A1F6C4A0_9BACT|nr:MAG: 30S ribosomal protein S13 [Candidatus Jorgensenbacteria bacterium RIFCSPLOWO2_12_FULL_42_11]